MDGVGRQSPNMVVGLAVRCDRYELRTARENADKGSLAPSLSHEAMAVWRSVGGDEAWCAGRCFKAGILGNRAQTQKPKIVASGKSNCYAREPVGCFCQCRSLFGLDHSNKMVNPRRRCLASGEGVRQRRSGLVRFSLGRLQFFVPWRRQFWAERKETGSSMGPHYLATPRERSRIDFPEPVGLGNEVELVGTSSCC